MANKILRCLFCTLLDKSHLNLPSLKYGCEEIIITDKPLNEDVFYVYLSKGILFQTAMDQLHMHFASAIHNTAFTVVLGYVELCSGTGTTNFQKRQYSDLCKVRLLHLGQS